MKYTAHILFAGAIFILGLAVHEHLFAQERIVLQTAPAAPTEYRIQDIRLRWGTDSTCAIDVRLMPNVGSVAFDYRFDGANACTMLAALNKADLSKTSLQKRILDRMIADKIIVGSVSGSPE